MGKIIKKIFKYILIISGSLAGLALALYIILQVPDIQTFIIHKITDRISREFKSTIQIGKVEYKFFNKLIINDLLIKDQNNDTLVFSEQAVTGIRKLYFRDNSVSFGRVSLNKTVVALITDTTGLLNLNWYLEKLGSQSDTSSKKSALITIDQIDFRDTRFSLVDKRGTPGSTEIDLKNLNIKELNGTIESFRIENDTTSLSVRNLSFVERSGLKIRKLSSKITISKGNIAFKDAFINCDSSIVNIPQLELIGDSTGSFGNFVEKVRINISFDKSLISASDLKYFVPFFRETDETIWLSGKISGTISELRGRNIHITYRDYTKLDCDFDFSGLPDINNTFIYLGVNRLITNAEDIERIIMKEGRNIEIPGLISKLGNIVFEGSFTGFTTDFVTYGKFFTSQGNITTDLSMRPEGKRKYRIRGILNGRDINLGEITGKRDLLGKMSIQANIDGYAYTLKKFAANLTGKIDSIDIKNYIYRDVALNGAFTEKTWDGSIKVSDHNIKMDILGLFNFENKLPEFDFTLNISKAKLYNLNFDKEDTSSSVTLLLTSNFKGNSIDNLDGEIRLLNSNFVSHGTSLELYDFSVRTFLADKKPVLSLRADFVDADITGRYNFGEFGNLAKYLMAKLMPSKFPSSVIQKDIKNNNFSFSIRFKNTDEINSFLKTGLMISENSLIEGDIYPDSLLRINGKAKKLSVFNNVFSDFTFNSGMTGNDFSMKISSSSFNLLKQSILDSFSVNFITKPDNFNFSVNWGKMNDPANKGDFKARGTFFRSNAQQKAAILQIEIDSSDIYARNNLWRINNSSVTIDSNAVRINNFLVGSNEYFYNINGAVSDNPEDTLRLGLKGIDINPLNYIISSNKDNPEDAFSPNFKGSLSGNIVLTDVYKELLLEGNLLINKFSVLGTEYGSLGISSAFDINRKVVNLNATNNLNGDKMLDITGFYDPNSKRIELTAIAKKLSITPLNPLLKSFASEITGTATGRVKLSGRSGVIVLNGALFAENSSMRIDYLKTKYRLSDSVRFDKRGIIFNNVKLTDEKGNLATLTGAVYHQNFKDFSSNLTVNFNDCLVLNTKAKDNELFYGTTYATGVTTIKSTKDGSISFDISAKSSKNTKFYIPLNTSLSVSEVSFVSFVDKNAEKIQDNKPMTKVTPAPANTTGMNVNMDLQVTPAAEVQLIFDLQVGDVMKANGSGDLNVNLNEKGELRITGDYIIDRGDYLFTLGNILNKPFSVDNGGKIMFNGNINDAEIDLKAIYRLRASLNEIMPPEAGGATTSTERVPVECQLNLSGKLFNPVIGFDIYLPTADEKTRTYLRNAIATEEQMSRQFIYLLVMNSFYPDQNIASNTTQSSGTAGTAAAVTTSEMLFSQLSNMLSKISNDFDIGVVYRPGVANSDINPDQLEVALSKQILNDKVIINGNFDVRGTGNNANTNQITGDFDAEVKLTEKIRFKVFNRYNNPYTGKTEPYTQGVGIFFRQDFNKFSDLKRKKEKSEIKKEEETTIKKE
jgi:hypothetical protein